MSGGVPYPRWLWDLLIAVQQYEDEHDMAHHCLDQAIQAVPQDVRDQAAAIRDYLAADQGGQ